MNRAPRRRRAARSDPADLPLGWRLLLSTGGVVLLLLGIAGLFLPGPGILGLLAGGALLSLASPRAYRVMRRLFRRWPRGWRRFEGFRRRTLRLIASVPPPTDEPGPWGGTITPHDPGIAPPQRPESGTQGRRVDPV